MASPPTPTELLVKPEVMLSRTPGVRERSTRVLRLKEELNLILELVVRARESLSQELEINSGYRNKSIDRPFLTKLKDLTSCYNSLAESRIRLDKAETAMEKEMTPAEEKLAVMDFIKSLDRTERYNALSDLLSFHVEEAGKMSRARKATWDEKMQLLCTVEAIQEAEVNAYGQ